ncbi:enoyl-CoA hydratase/isomerase family protein [Deferribacter desulfuricans SSM1]|uniref:Enoyl-CoA hydratase/isomerase family protein n=1 Tax=Deferribacter desulfuricans (strain DSM 14783 / JCM 11476 / NBRC 101012 / SSM1) TaxID=639282 RepID=D3P9Y5_DEFDS|nr:enoyl-CoA hydratase-related protein [Deferribacter desulfuricans]BAI81525.1 enoyl-CoA hydratase/isomerase family protein [Deferribacter desulfuricans SSM1]
MIELSVENEVAYLTLKPEEKFNILNTHTIKEIINSIKHLIDSPAKVLRIFGEGGSFAVGANIRTMLGYSGFDAKGFSILGNRLFNLLQDIPQVVIAEIDGFCMGGGVDFAAAADFRFATKRSKFAHPGSKLGIITGFGGTQRIPRVMKQSYYQKLFITGDLFDADFMYRGGFLFGICEDKDDLRQNVDNFVRKIINKNRVHIYYLKQMVNKGR